MVEYIALYYSCDEDSTNVWPATKDETSWDKCTNAVNCYNVESKRSGKCLLSVPTVCPIIVQCIYIYIYIYIIYIYIYILKTLIRPYDVTLIYAVYAKCGKIQMAGLFKRKFCKYK